MSKPKWSKGYRSDRLSHHLEKHNDAVPTTKASKPPTSHSGSVTPPSDDPPDLPSQFHDVKRERKQERAKKSHIPAWASDAPPDHDSNDDDDNDHSNGNSSAENDSNTNEKTSLTAKNHGRGKKQQKKKRARHQPYGSYGSYVDVPDEFTNSDTVLEEGGYSASPLDELGDVSRTPLHRFFICYTSLSILALTCCLTSQILMIVYKSHMGAVQLSTRAYGAIFAVLGVFIEFEAGQGIQNSVLMNWCARGFWYSYLGVMGLEESIVVDVASSDIQDAAYVSVFVRASSMAMIGLGIGYFVMGCACLRSVRDRRIAAYKTARKQRDLRLAMLEEEQLH